MLISGKAPAAMAVLALTTLLALKAWPISAEPAAIELVPHRAIYELSLGKVLAYLWIEDAFRRKEIVEFNFMRGDSEFKRKFTDQHRWNQHFIVRHPRSLYVRGIGLAEKVLKSR